MPVSRNDKLDAAEQSIVASFSAGLKSTAEEELKHVEKNWDNGQDALGRSWTPLSAETIRRKGHGRILRERGDMRESGFVRRKGMLTTEIGFSDPKINLHEFGGENLPPRKVIEPMKIHLRSGGLKSSLARKIGQTITSLR